MCVLLCAILDSLSRCNVFVCVNHLVLADPSGSGGTRELLWYDIRNNSAAAGSYTVDTGSGTLLPLFDADTGMMVMPSKGDGSIRCVCIPRACLSFCR